MDTLDGGKGIDTMIGGAGNDIYVVDNIKDIVNEKLAGPASTPCSPRSPSAC